MCRRELLYIARNYHIVANVGNLKQTTHLLLSTTKAPKTLPSPNHRKHTTDIEVETEIFACYELAGTGPMHNRIMASV